MPLAATRKTARATLRATVCALTLASASFVQAAQPLELKGFSLRAPAPKCGGSWWEHNGVALCSILNPTLLAKPIRGLTLAAYRGRIVGVTAYVSDERHAMEAKDALAEKFGEPLTPSEQVWLWERGVDRLVVVYSVQAMAWTVTLADMSVDARIKKDQQDAPHGIEKGKKRDL